MISTFPEFSPKYKLPFTIAAFATIRPEDPGLKLIFVDESDDIVSTPEIAPDAASVGPLPATLNVPLIVVAPVEGATVTKSFDPSLITNLLADASLKM